jgi:hypothetical protein
MGDFPTDFSKVLTTSGPDIGGAEYCDSANLSVYALGNKFLSMLSICATLSALPLS